MSYQVLARKWRPQTFDQLVGQNHISQTLRNALQNGRLPHALLFTGPRGTGKTSSARILAKSLRCPDAKDFKPCNVCTSCEDVALSRSVDVMEIDGASNNGVDAIRELREGVGYRPSSGSYKIYIIDEVHMLSTSAFNALLKTLEEPPDHVIFIMATTEVHKIPQTILSRCQRFDFRRIATRTIADHLKNICQSEKIKNDDEALWMIARQGDGSMRDSLSLLDQVMTFSNQNLNLKTVTDVLGLTDRSVLLETLTALVTRDSQQILKSLEKILTAGYEPFLFAENILELIRHLLVLKVAGDNSHIVDLPDSEIRFLKDLGSQSSQEEMHLLFDMALKGSSEIDRASEPRLVLEMLMLRMAAAPRVMDLQSLLSGAVQSVPVQPQAPAAKIAAPAAKPAATKTADLIKNSTGLNPGEKWLELVQQARDKDALFAAKIANLLFMGVKDKVVELSIPAKLSFLKDQMADAAIKEKLQGLVVQGWGADHRFEMKVVKEATSGGISAQGAKAEEKVRKEKNLMQQVQEHPQVQKAAQVFKGQVKTIQSVKSGEKI